jgi:hypothetical protein
MATRMQQRRGTAADFAAQNPVLSAGELGFETDTKVIKVGDGVTAWNALTTPYLTAGGGTMTGPLSLVQPTDPSHAARLADVEANSGAGRVLRTGDTMSGALQIASNTYRDHLKLLRDGNQVDVTPGPGGALILLVNNSPAATIQASGVTTLNGDVNVTGVFTTANNPRVFIQSGDPGSAAKSNDLWGW